MQVKTHFRYLTLIAALAGALVWIGIKPTTALPIVANPPAADKPIATDMHAQVIAAEPAATGDRPNRHAAHWLYARIRACRYR